MSRNSYGNFYLGGGDFFAQTLGFVIEGVPHGSIERAVDYLKKTCDMTDSEAYGYCRRIRKEYMSAIQEGECQHA